MSPLVATSRFVKSNRTKSWSCWPGYTDIGLTSKGSGADSARNITASPTAGFDPLEITDLHSYALRLSHQILNTRDLKRYSAQV